MTPQNETVLDNYVTRRYLCRMFRCTGLTVDNWRNKLGLPYIRIPGDGRDTIRFDLERVKEWARENEKPTYQVTED